MADMIVTPDEAAALLYGGDSSKAKGNVVRQMCADGRIAHAEKFGSKWRINATREWPHLFGGQPEPEPAPVPAPEPERPRVTVDTTVGELLAMLLGQLALETGGAGR